MNHDPDRPYLDRQVPLNAKALQALGAISCIWGEIGSAIETLIWVLANLFDDENLVIERQILTSQLSIHNRKRVIANLLLRRRLHEGFNQDVKRALKEYGKLAVIRNSLFHAPEWYVNFDTSPAISYVRSAKLGGTEGFYSEPQRLTQEQFKELVTRMADCRDDVRQLVADAQLHCQIEDNE